MRNSFGSLEVEYQGNRTLITGEIQRDDDGTIVRLINATVKNVQDHPRFTIELPDDAVEPEFARNITSTKNYMERIRG